MAIEVACSSPGTRAPLAASRVRALVTLALEWARVHHAQISVTFISSRAMARLNREQLGHDGATDIITFELARPVASAPVSGDLYICAAVARKNAQAWGVAVREELARLVIHGTLHAIGHEHPDGDARMHSPMWRAQERLVQRAITRGIVRGR
jgi:probable rRNA maturation factor